MINQDKSDQQLFLKLNKIAIPDPYMTWAKYLNMIHNADKALRDDLVGFEYSFTEHWEPNMLARSRIHLCAVIFAGFVLFGFWLLKAIGYIA